MTGKKLILHFPLMILGCLGCAWIISEIVTGLQDNIPHIEGVVCWAGLIFGNMNIPGPMRGLAVSETRGVLAHDKMILAMDVVLGFLIIALAFLPMMITAIIIKVTDPTAPVLYWSKRIGYGGRPFLFPKFRSMHSGAEAAKDQLLAMNEREGVFFKMRADPRITPVGRFIRKWSVDELPQLFSVLTGKMSLIGPRPVLPEEFARFDNHDKHIFMVVRPGISGLAQVNGRADLSHTKEYELNHLYARKRSLGLYLWLLFIMTPIAVIKGRGAY